MKKLKSKEFLLIVGCFSGVYLLEFISIVVFLLAKTVPLVSIQYINSSFFDRILFSIKILMESISTTPLFDASVSIEYLKGWEVIYLFFSFCIRALTISIGGLAILVKKKWGVVLLSTILILSLIHGLAWQLLYFQHLSLKSTLLFIVIHLLFLYVLTNKRIRPDIFCC